MQYSTPLVTVVCTVHTMHKKPMMLPFERCAFYPPAGAYGARISTVEDERAIHPSQRIFQLAIGPGLEALIVQKLFQDFDSFKIHFWDVYALIL